MGEKPKYAFYCSDQIFKVAKAAYERTKDAPSERSFFPNEPLVAIVFSMAALESFINEAVMIARQSLASGVSEPKSVKTFVILLEAAEEARVTTPRKFLREH